MSAMATTVRDSVLDRLPRGNRLVAWIGVLLGLLAFFIALPPFTVRSFVPSILLGLLGLSAGVWGVTRRRARRVVRVVLGILGGSLGCLATLSSVTKLDTVVVWSALLAARSATRRR